jgi:hypothetical protein
MQYVGCLMSVTTVLHCSVMHNAAVGSAFAGSIGAFTGGILMSRTKMTPVGAVRLMIFASSVFATGLLVIVFLACPQVEFAGGIDPTSQTYELRLLSCTYT